MSQPLRALIFDVDGTLADTEEAHRQAFNQASGAFGLDRYWTADRYTGRRSRRPYGGQAGEFMQVKAQRIRAVAFDLDGTLIDTLPDLAAAVNATLVALGGPPLSASRVKELVGDGADQLILRAVNESMGGAAVSIEPAQRPVALDHFFRFYSEHLFVHSRLYPDTVQTLRELAGAGIRLCCVTNKSSRFALPLLELTGLAPFMAFTLCADRTEERKPSPALVLEACRRLGAAPDEVLYVGDSHTDVVAAHAAGCLAAAVTFGYHKHGALETVRADAVVTRLADIVEWVLQRSNATAGEPGQIHGAST